MEKGIMLVSSIFYFSHNVFYPIKDKSKHFSKSYFVACKSMGECYTVLHAYTTYRHLKWYCTHPSKFGCVKLYCFVKSQQEPFLKIILFYIANQPYLNFQKKSESSALLVLPSEEGSASFMTIPVTLSGGKSGDPTKITVQGLGQSVREEPAKPQSTVKEDKTVTEQSVKDSEISEKTDEFVVDSKENNEVVDFEDIQETEKVGRTGRSSSKKRKKDKKSKTENIADINNVNRPHSSVDRGTQRVHFLLPDDESEALRPKTAGHVTRKGVDEYPGAHAFNQPGHFEITDMSAFYDTSDKAPLTAWAEEQRQSSVSETPSYFLIYLLLDKIHFIFLHSVSLCIKFISLECVVDYIEKKKL